MMGFVAFLSYFAGGLGLLLAFVGLYVHLTPHKEFELIRQGNKMAALSLSGSVMGYAIVLHTAIAHSVSGVDMLIWSGIGLSTQYIAYRLFRHVFLRGWKMHVEADNVAAGILSAALSISIGLLNAASMTY